MSQATSRRLGASLAFALCLGFATAGAVRPMFQVALHAVLLVSLGWLAFRRGPPLPASRALWVSVGCLTVAQVASLLPAPGTPTQVVSVAPWRTLSMLSVWALVVGVCALTSAWAARARSVDVFRLFTSILGVLVLCASLHEGLGLDRAMGLFAIEHRPVSYWGPLVNANHLATCMLLLWPCALHVARSDPTARWRALGVATALGAVAVFVLVQSIGAALVAAVVGSLAWTRERDRGLFGALTLVTGLALGSLYLTLQPTWLDNSFIGRWDQYAGTAQMFVERPWFGWGAGTYEQAFAPFDGSGRFVKIEHAHSDLLEWMSETGVFGLVCGGVALGLSLRIRDVRETSSRVLGYGLLAAMLHACVEFPLRIPAVAMLFASVWVVWMARDRSPVTLPRIVQRRVVLAIAALQIPAGFWAFREQMAQDTAVEMRADPRPATIERFARWAPWSAEAGLAELVWVVQSGDLDRAQSLAEELASRHPTDPDVRRRVGVLMAHLGMDEAARLHLEASVRTRPSDFRSYLALGRLAARSGQGQEAVTRYGQALRRAPIDAELLEEAYALLPIGDHWVDVLADAEPHLSVLLYRVIHRDEPEAAWRAIEQAVALRPAYYKDHPLRADALVALGRYEEARAWLTPRLSADNRGNLWVLLGVTEEREGNLDAAVAAYLEAEARGSEHARVNAVRAIRAVQGEADALAQARAWVDAGEGSPRLIMELAVLAYQTGDAASCLEALSMDRLLAYQEWSERVHTQRARCESLSQETNASPG